MNKMEAILNYVKPELMVVAIVLYFVGMALKKAEYIQDKFIPIIIGIFGVMLSLVWVLATSTMNGYQDVLLAVFTAIIQGILCAGLSTYVNQTIKQLGKEE